MPFSGYSAFHGVNVNKKKLQKVEAQWSHSWLLLEGWFCQNQTLGKDLLVKIFHGDKLHGIFPDLDFGDADDKDDIFLDALQVMNDSVPLSY